MDRCIYFCSIPGFHQLVGTTLNGFAVYPTKLCAADSHFPSLFFNDSIYFIAESAL